MTNYRKRFTYSALIAAFGIMGSGAVLADGDDPQKMRLIAETAGLITLEQASEKALAAKPGTIIEAELDDRQWPAGWDYEFEIIDKDGKEWDVDIDAKTGEVRKVSKEWF
jgi:uncharacterized membrane protein YkoI